MEPTEPPELIKKPSWLTEELIEEALRKGDSDPEIIVDSIESKFLVGKGENYASVVNRITVTYRDGEGNQIKKPLIIKSTHENSVMKRFVKEAHLFDKETYAYSKLLPAMAPLTETPLVSPKFYPTEQEDAVILEDLSVHGFKMADRKKRLDLAHCFVALKALARFHGQSYAVVQKNPTIIDYFPESMYTERLREMNSRFLPQIYGSLASIIGTWPGYERFYEKISCRVDNIITEMEEMVAPKKDGFNVLNHGDFWVNNMLFRYNEDTNIVEEVCLIDLQVVRYGSPALDLQYFFVSSLADGIREEYEDVLLETYHKELIETLKSVNQRSVIYTIEDLKRDYLEKAIFGFNTGCFLLGAVVADSSEAFDLDSITEESLNDGTANPMEKTFQGKRFRDVLQKLLLFYEDKRVI